jgi:hypothetical protein
MKKLLSLLCAVLFLSCAELEQTGSSMVSGVIGLHRVITLYAADGSVIKQWEGRYNIKSQYGMARFMDNGKAITIAGTFIIEEK